MAGRLHLLLNGTQATRGGEALVKHVLTRNGLSYTCLCCHRVLGSRDEYARISCEVDADSDRSAQRRAARWTVGASAATKVAA